MTETALSPDTILQLAPNFRTRLDVAGHVIVDSPAGTVIDIGPQGFAILSMFSRPVTLGEAIERLETEFGGSTEFAPTMSVVNMLIEENARRAVPRRGDRLVPQHAGRRPRRPSWRRGHRRLRGGKIKALRAYFDDSTLLEQMLVA